MAAKSLLSKESSTGEIRAYFNAVLKLSQSDKTFPVNLDEVWMLSYSRKEEAVRALQRDFIEDVDYQVLRSNAENYQGGRPSLIYQLSVSCLEYLIARKIRLVFEVYRKVFHKTVKNVSMGITQKEFDKLKEELNFTKNQLKYTRIISDQESELKNSCFFFLIGKGLYTEYHEWLRKQITKQVTSELQKSINY